MGSVGSGESSAFGTPNSGSLIDKACDVVSGDAGGTEVIPVFAESERVAQPRTAVRSKLEEVRGAALKDNLVICTGV